MDESYWKDLYFKTYAENNQLRLKLETLEKAYDELKQKYKALTKPPKGKNQAENNKIRFSHSVDINRNEMIAQSIVACVYEIEPRKSHSPCGSLKITQNRSLRGSFKSKLKVTQNEISLYEELFVLSLSSSTKKCSIVSRYPNAFDIPAYGVLPEFCFPAGISAKEFSFNESNSKFNELLYCQDFSKRERMFVFTLKPQEVSYSNSFEILDILYCCCVVIDDIGIIDDRLWEIPKCFCLISYFPLFSLHFEFLNKLLLTIRIRKIEEIGGLTASYGKLNRSDLTEKETNLLEDYRSKPEPQKNLVFQLDVPLQDPLVMRFSDLVSDDLFWLCGPIFSLLRFEDFFYVWVSVLLEKSVVVVSSNLSLITSIILSLKYLIRPLIWPHVFLPIIPESLNELLDAPVPLLIGLPDLGKIRMKKYQNIIWVLPEEPEKKRLLIGSEVSNEVKEMDGEGLKNRLKQAYSCFDRSEISYTCSKEQERAVKNVVYIMNSYLTFVVEAIPKYKSTELVDSQRIKNDVLPMFNKTDFPFLKAFLSTQMVMSNIQ